MGLITVIGVVLIATFLAVLLKPYRAEYALAVSLIAGVVVLAYVFGDSIGVLTSLQALLERSAMSEMGGTLFRALGICLLTQMASDACRDVGEQSMAAKAELVGKVFLLALALPLLENVAQVAEQLLLKGNVL